MSRLPASRRILPDEIFGTDNRGARFASLSRIAREITGTRWSGPLFFGLRKAAQQEASTHDH